MHRLKDKYPATIKDGEVSVPQIEITGLDSENFESLHTWLTFEERIAGGGDVVNTYKPGLSKADIVAGMTQEERAGLRLGIRALIREGAKKITELADSEFDESDIM